MESITIEREQFAKMQFIWRAIESGWSAKKQSGSYVFKKKHNGKQEVFREEYLEEFLRKNIELK
jgi:hypothetical protein